MLKRIIKWLENRRSRKQADYRATALAVKLVITGALTSCNRGVAVLPIDKRRQA